MDQCLQILLYYTIPLSVVIGLGIFYMYIRYKKYWVSLIVGNNGIEAYCLIRSSTCSSSRECTEVLGTESVYGVNLKFAPLPV